jgi:hypothetical protein
MLRESWRNLAGFALQGIWILLTALLVSAFYRDKILPQYKYDTFLSQYEIDAKTRHKGSIKVN